MTQKSTPSNSQGSARRKERHRQQAPVRWWQGPWLMGGSIGLLVAAIVGIMLLSQRQTADGLPSESALATVIEQVTHVPAAVFDAIGSGGVPNPLTPDASVVELPGKPRVLYVGAEFCPYCASERWSLIVALSRFGQFENLAATQSAGNDVYPNTPTFTFSGIRYTSPYLQFVPVETAARDRAPLQRPTTEQQAVMAANDPGGSIPFIDIAGRVHAVGSGVDTSLLVGKTWADIAARLTDPTDPATRAIIGNANYLTAAICQAADNQPASVCSSAAVASLSAELARNAVGGDGR